MRFCLFDLLHYVQVNSYGHIRMLPQFHGTFTQHWDVMTFKILTSKVCMYGWFYLTTFPGQA